MKYEDHWKKKTCRGCRFTKEDGRCYKSPPGDMGYQTVVKGEWAQDACSKRQEG